MRSLGEVAWAAGAIATISTVTALYCRYRHAQDYRQLETRMHHLRCEDELTGLIGKQGFTYIGQMMVDLARRDGAAIGMCIFKPRQASDHNVLTVAEAAQDVFRASDLIARLDDHQIVVLGKGDGFTSEVVERVRSGIIASAPPGENVDIDVGVAVLAPWDGGGLEDLLAATRATMPDTTRSPTA